MQRAVEPPAAPDLPHEPFLALPGFPPGAIGFAFRTRLALLLAYFVAFWSQLDTASSAGICVAIVAQPSPGMAMSKALYRIFGTVLGGVVAIGMVGAFGQDRTVLLAAFTLWLGACSFIAALLRDFRSYGAVLSGYTVGIIAIGGIDAPEGSVLSMLNRVAAILLGVVAVALVNSFVGRSVSFESLHRGLRDALAKVRAIERRALAGAPPPDPKANVELAATILTHTSEATYAATELPDGPARIAGARATIAALLAMLSAIRGIGLAHTSPLAEPDTIPGRIFLQEREAELALQQSRAEAGLQTLGFGGHRVAPVRLRLHYDTIGAALSATRTMIAVGLGAAFCIYSGWPGITLLLIQQAAFTALLGMQPNPSRAAATFGWALPAPALLAGLAGFVVLPAVSGFVPFALVTGTCAFLFVLLGQLPVLAPISAGQLLYFTLLLSPSNVQTFDFDTFANTVLIQIVAILFMVLAFRLILPVSQERRLSRLAQSIIRDLRRTLRHGRGLDPSAFQSLKYDRLQQVLAWLGRPTPARLAVFGRLYAFAELDTALRRAWSGLDAARDGMPGLKLALDAATAALLTDDPARIETAARALAAGDQATNPAMLRAISGMYGAQFLLARQSRALRHYRVR